MRDPAQVGYQPSLGGHRPPVEQSAVPLLTGSGPPPFIHRPTGIHS
ncbi:hypothetical protein [Micromonospora sp. CPCC 206060]